MAASKADGNLHVLGMVSAVLYGTMAVAMVFINKWVAQFKRETREALGAHASKHASSSLCWSP